MGRFTNRQSLLGRVLELEGIVKYYTEEPQLLTFSTLDHNLSFFTDVDLPVGKDIPVEQFEFEGKSFKVTVEGKEYRGNLSLNRAIGIKPLSVMYLIALDFGKVELQSVDYNEGSTLFIWLNENTRLELPNRFTQVVDTTVKTHIVRESLEDLYVLFLGMNNYCYLELKYRGGNIILSTPATGESYIISAELMKVKGN